MAENTTSSNAPTSSPNTAGSHPAESSNGANFGIDVSNQSLREVIGSLPAEQKKSGGAATGGQAKVVKTPQERKEDLLARLPKDPEKCERFLKNDIQKNLNDKLEELESGLHGAKSYYEMNNTLAKIREFRDILYDLASYALDQLKAVWLRFVHNLSI